MTAPPSHVLSTPMGDNDAGAATIGDYLESLLATLWEERAGFDGKRPFGNSGWHWHIYHALAKAELVAASWDADGDLSDVDRETADKLVHEAIRAVFQSEGPLE